MASLVFEHLSGQESPLSGETAVVSVPVRASLVCRVLDISPLPEVRIYDRVRSGNIGEGNLLRGVAWALGLEAAAVFGILGVWNLLHVLR